MSFRVRVVLYYSCLVVGILFVFGAAVFGTLQWAMRNQIESSLDKVAEEVLDDTRGQISYDENGKAYITTYVPSLDTFRTPGIFVQIWEVNSVPILVSSSQNLQTFKRPLDAQALTGQAEERSTVTINGVNLRVVTRPLEVQGQVIAYVQAASSLSMVEAALNRLTRIMIGGGVVALLVSFFIGNLLASQVLRPVSEIATTASNITSASDLSLRIPHKNTNDELGTMVQAFNQTLERLQTVFEDQKKLVEKQQKLLLAQKNFIEGASHELRTPLTIMRGNIDMLRRRNDQDSLDIIEEEIQHMTLIIGDLMMLAQADAGEIKLNFRRLDLGRLVDEMYRYALEKAGNSHEVSLIKNEPIYISADPEYLHRLFTHIIDNAILYSPHGGRLEISLQVIGLTAYVNVRDNGIGISDENLPFIFNPFFRADKARKRGGTGLGLSIAEWIAEVHNGKITVVSQEGKGSQFMVALPVPEDLARTEISGSH